MRQRSGSYKRPDIRSLSRRLPDFQRLAARPAGREADEELADRAHRRRERAIRACNVAVAAAALLLLSPLILLIAILVRLDSPGPIIYRQLRVGIDRRNGGDPTIARNQLRRYDLGGCPFMIYKFRTMRVDAEDDTGPVWARPDDDRTTRVGRWLRRTRLDEIPQFWNVLRGDMSVVGPRPERPNFVGRLRRELVDYPVRHRVRPGITGWAQVNKGYDQTLDDVRAKLHYDLEYVRRQSVWLDLRIMMKTVPVMLVRRPDSREEDSG